ncbi:hypothetical protein NL676_007184 [Syzygium grande]|nr:hypothetical protein NL676_007184 [Syzygium grande]
MAPNPKVKAAFAAMRAIGISEDKVKPVLKKLLKLYEKKLRCKSEKSAADEDDLEEEAQMHEVERPLKKIEVEKPRISGLCFS